LIAESLLEFVLYFAILEIPNPPRGTTTLVAVIIGLVCALNGNRWYLVHAQRAIRQVRARGLDETTFLKELSRRGSTSIVTPILSLILLYVTWIVIYRLLGWMIASAFAPFHHPWLD